VDWAQDEAASANKPGKSKILPVKHTPTKEEQPKEDEAADSISEVYTIHQHPVFIVTRGLHQHLNHVWEHFLAGGNDMSVNAGLAWQFAGSLNAGELNALMAIHALDFGDFTLAICHLKNALSALNHSMSMLQHLPSGGGSANAQFFREAQAAMFDLRETWLRVMNDCRIENSQRGPDGQTPAE